MISLINMYHRYKYGSLCFTSQGEAINHSLETNDVGLFKFILNNNNIDCLSEVMNNACRLGRLTMVRELLRRYNIGVYQDNIRNAMLSGNVELVRLLSTEIEIFSSDIIIDSMDNDKREMFDIILTNMDNVDDSILKLCIVRERMDLFNFVAKKYLPHDLGLYHRMVIFCVRHKYHSQLLNLIDLDMKEMWARYDVRILIETLVDINDDKTFCSIINIFKPTALYPVFINLCLRKPKIIDLLHKSELSY